MKTTASTAPRIAKPAKLIGGTVCTSQHESVIDCLIYLGGDAAHVQVSYPVFSDRGPRTVHGVVPWPVWCGSPNA